MSPSPNVRLSCGLVLRRSPQDPRVFLALRAPQLAAFGGLWAFPGGTVRRGDEALAERVEDHAEAHAPFVAALAREMLEELGLCLARLHPPLKPTERDALRTAVLKNPDAFGRFLEERKAAIPGAALRPLAHMLTPSFARLRFATQFFWADLSEWKGEPSPRIWEGELVDGAWETPARWLERWQQGELLLAPPVVLILRVLRDHGFEQAAQVMDGVTAQFTQGRMHPIFYSPAAQLMPVRAPTIPPATHTNVYLVGRDPAYLIDPAAVEPDERARLDVAIDEAARWVGSDGGMGWAGGVGSAAGDRGEDAGAAPIAGARRIAAIVLTHHHPDHIGSVEHLRARLGVPVWAHAATRDLLAGRITVDRLLHDGDRLPLGRSPKGDEGWELEVLFTPGHAAGHICLFERAYGTLIVGDMISTLSSILIHPDDGDMVQYLASLERLAELPARVVFPSHGPATAAGARAIAVQLQHRRQREAAILAAIRGGAGDVAAVVAKVYTDVPAEMHPYAALSVRSVVRKLVAEGSARERDGQLMAS